MNNSKKCYLGLIIAILSILNIFRRSHQRYSTKKLLLNISKYSQETLVWESLFYKVCNFTKKTPTLDVFSVNIGKFLRAPILKNICEQLFLHLQFEKDNHFFQFCLVKAQRSYFVYFCLVKVQGSCFGRIVDFI